LLLLLKRYGAWGVCFTYATWFGVSGLVAAGTHIYTHTYTHTYMHTQHMHTYIHAYTYVHTHNIPHTTHTHTRTHTHTSLHSTLFTIHIIPIYILCVCTCVCVQYQERAQRIALLFTERVSSCLIVKIMMADGERVIWCVCVVCVCVCV